MCGGRTGSAVQAIASRGCSVRAGFKTWGSAHARIQRRREARCVADVRDASSPPLLVAARLVLGEVARTRLSIGSPALRWCTWMRRAPCGSLSGRGRVECRCRLRPFHRSGLGVLLAADQRSAASKRSTRGVVEEWRSIATRDDSKLRASQSRVKLAIGRAGSTCLHSRPSARLIKRDSRQAAWRACQTRRRRTRSRSVARMSGAARSRVRRDGIPSSEFLRGQSP
jgi:hypothetical protein